MFCLLSFEDAKKYDLVRLRTMVLTDITTANTVLWTECRNNHSWVWERWVKWAWWNIQEHALAWKRQCSTVDWVTEPGLKTSTHTTPVSIEYNPNVQHIKLPWFNLE